MSDKIINDPLYGFISLDTPLLQQVVAHPYFQRLRRITQMGLAGQVYPSAQHNRFSHSLGAMHLMHLTLQALRAKGHKSDKKDREAAKLAILLHDIGHCPYSHTLEHTLLDVHHEQLSLLFMQRLNEELDGQLSQAIKVFCGTHKQHFLHELVSSQLDMDRLDYLQRDCFYTGVVEGSIGAKRIIRMLDVVDDHIVVDQKAIYSVENFLTARRIMYWQVYMHKTCIAAEQMLIGLLERARELAESGAQVPCSPALAIFLQTRVSLEQFEQQPGYLQAYAQLDDFDVMGAVKQWRHHPDRILSSLSGMLLDRQLFQTIFSETPFTEEQLQQVQKQLLQAGYSAEELPYFCQHGSLSNAAYVPTAQNINILTKGGEIVDIAQASELPNIQALSKIVTKYYLCTPKVISL